MEVPKTTVFSGLTIDTTKELTGQNYNNIKNELITYVSTYRYSWTDEWYDGCGLTSDEYTIAYQKMLKSVYTYGGFWIGRYEAGIERSIDDVSKARISHSTVTVGTSPKAISQKDAIPYNFVYCSEAQALAKEMTPDSNYTSSLMFGIQWDLVCKFLEVKSGLETSEINSNSTSWGNYNNAKIENIASGKYAILDTNTWDLGTWTKITSAFTKSDSEDNSSVLLSTGITDYTKKMNIYDFAGNEWEWTLEKTSDSNLHCAYRGGGYGNQGSDNPASYRDGSNTTYSSNFFGFRCALYK